MMYESKNLSPGSCDYELLQNCQDDSETQENHILKMIFNTLKQVH